MDQSRFIYFIVGIVVQLFIVLNSQGAYLLYKRVYLWLNHLLLFIKLANACADVLLFNKTAYS